ncbi:putative mitogen-activated protein kinase [Leishmania major strain Friedlin]|uniref:Mitogen-activated protein kinase n=1 Tax=Leishmania major TaxID=5664 RepID=Q4Q7S2_LEIMA|nr:putative mitogen-activated protein kinase [Leishmania major strain Friedlin]CAG9578162.1 mitogen-activated_protein_kinase_-_putative [Leishmania major strain Friedlin]CAJ05857.1 putative mitogen-activated protein kinase [Leishmania major strain Friedlin]|eukprot:XP_001684626.1 putative mitogen-activated protein kinase [Leishmania major strain Friedlin]
MILTKVEGPNAAGNKVYVFGVNDYRLEVPERYNVQHFVGRGAYGFVCSAVDAVTNEPVAIKKVMHLFDDAVDAKRVLREVKLLAYLKHPNILSLKDLFKSPDPVDTYSELYVVTDLMESDMDAILRSPRIRLAAGHGQYFTLQLLCALQYIHSAHVLHRDLKPGNLLTDSECNLKLGDFGLARGIGHDDTMTQYVFTRWYRPPELLLVCKHCNYSADMWAVGCLAAEMFTGKPLFPGKDYINQINLIVELLGIPDLARDLPPSTSKEAIHYLSSLPPSKGKKLEEYAPELRRRFDETTFYDSFDTELEEAIAVEGAIIARPRPHPPEEYYAEFVDFIFGLLCYNPAKRRTAKESIAHAWLSDVRGPQETIGGCEAERIYRWDADGTAFTIPQLRQLFIDEIGKFASTRSS